MPPDLSNPLPGRSRREAAQHIREKFGLPCKAETLANMASDGNGPIYRLVAGRAYYLDHDLDEWALARISPPIRKASDARRPTERASA